MKHENVSGHIKTQLLLLGLGKLREMARLCLRFSPSPPGHDPGSGLPLCLAVYLSYELKPGRKSI